MTKKGTKIGRRPRYETQMPSTAITAAAHQLTLWMILGDGIVSQGARRGVEMLVEADPEAERSMGQAMWMVEKAQAALEAAGEEATQKTMYRWVADRFWDLAEEYAAEQQGA